MPYRHAFLEVIPAIDLLQGHAVRLYQGDYAQAEQVADDPIQQAEAWAAQGAPRLHVVDLDGARSGDPVNLPIIERIVRQVAIPVQVGGGIRSLQRARQLLELGVDRIIVSTVAVEDPNTLEAMTQALPGRIWVGIDARQGQVATRGWLNTTPLQATELVQRLEAQGVAGIIYTDISRDGTLAGPNLEQLRQVLAVSRLPVIASGGIGSLTDLLALLSLSGLAGVILGKALYSGAISLPEALRAVGPGRWQDLPPAKGSLWA
ncbi:1-(5-phosphoribosyl)-5-[(5-phosphoribosylamino)methylideneamino]imidazole-4-carboxamide isomerase [Synechococcus sp. H65.1]|uniref:1-(5-phosphoribosyl)-5-[(5- phosphoribosylamino)methylideneamino]imidazole-4- carboxamide isomerase n=1 Tax=unclassified Synechococcus TaxID=2626047 RepID=UPI0039C05042